ncbi:MAG TPA: hypothetical protein VF532_08090 [Candidatus Angelobacter sp.]
MQPMRASALLQHNDLEFFYPMLFDAPHKSDAVFILELVAGAAENFFGVKPGLQGELTGLLPDIKAGMHENSARIYAPEAPFLHVVPLSAHIIDLLGDVIPPILFSLAEWHALLTVRFMIAQKVTKPTEENDALPERLEIRPLPGYWRRSTQRFPDSAKPQGN